MPILNMIYGATGGGGGGRLPAGYQEVEYIQSSGTQYIDSGISGKNDMVVKTKCIFTNLGGSNEDLVLLGSNGTYPNYAFYISKQGQGGNSRFMATIENTFIYGGSISLNTEYVIESSLLKSGCYLKVNGSTIGTATYTSDYDNGYNMYIFARNNTGTTIGYFQGKLYYLTLEDANGDKIADYVPCYRELDSVIGLYDLVNDVFYTNDGTGTFTKGPDVN